MLGVDIDESSGILLLEPQGELQARDFALAAEVADRYIETQGGLAGLIIHVASFPGWDSFEALAAHLKFVREHHREIARVALATNSPIGTLAEKLAGHFVAAEIRCFDFDALAEATAWVRDTSVE